MALLEDVGCDSKEREHRRRKLHRVALSVKYPRKAQEFGPD